MTGQHPDSLRAILDSVFARKEYRWVQRPDPLAALKRMRHAIWQWLTTLHDGHPAGFQVVGYGLGVLALAIVLHAAWSFFRGVRSADSLTAGGGTGFTPRDQAWYRGEAERLADAGRFAEAIQVDFVALVLALDARQVLRFHPSKTPGEYARESRLEPGRREDFRELVYRLYRYAFARTPCGPAEYAEWRARAVADRYAPAH
jgi:hypothetical protein